MARVYVTLAVLRESPIMIKPTMWSGLSGSSSTASANTRIGPTIQFCASDVCAMGNNAYNLPPPEEGHGELLW
jgi:hypothetical protein